MSSAFDVFALDVTDRVSNFGRRPCDVEDSKGDFVDWAHADVLKVQASLHPLFRSTGSRATIIFERRLDSGESHACGGGPPRRATGPPPTSCLSWRFNNEPPAGLDARHAPIGLLCLRVIPPCSPPPAL